MPQLCKETVHKSRGRESLEWTIVTVLVTMAGLFLSVMTPLLKLNSTIIRLNASVDALNEEMEKYTVKNDQSHDRLWRKSDEQSERLNDHEKRIVRLEQR